VARYRHLGRRGTSRPGQAGGTAAAARSRRSGTA